MIARIFISCLLMWQLTAAQDLPPTTQQQVENAAEALEDESQKDDNYLQQLDFLTRHPININTATAEDLQPLRMLSDLQIQHIIQYRNSLGNFIDVYELQAVPTLDVISIRKIRPYVYVGDALSVKENFLSRFGSGEQYVLGRISRVLEQAKGYDTSLNTHYLGNRDRYLLRYRYDYKGILQYGAVADKDAGEQFFKGAQKQGFDFYSFHFFVRKLGKVKALALGDYLVSFGQGLIQWQSQAFGKSAEVLSIKRQAPALVPYRSAGEFFFNRGVAITRQFKNVEATAFISSKKFSGNAFYDSVERFSSFLTSGYYRTKNEVADRYNLNDLSFGASVSYQHAAFRIALNSVGHHFSKPLQKSREPYNYFAASGSSMLNSSADYSLTYRNMHFFGEAAVDKNLNAAFVNGLLMSVDPKIDLAFFHRNISEKYQSFYGNAFTVNTLPTNEKGFYAGIAIRPSVGWLFNAYADIYRFPYLKYRVDAPSTGADYLLQLTYVPSRSSEIYLRYKNDRRSLNESGSQAPINFPVEHIKKNIRFHYSMQLRPEVGVKARAEMLWYDRHGTLPEEGFLTYIEGNLKTKSSWNGNLRLQYFETGGYNSRIYAYESDVLYSFSIPAFYDKGFRYYLNVNYDVDKHFSFWIRFAQTVFRDKNVIGSGLDEINGSKKSEVRFQFMWRF